MATKKKTPRTKKPKAPKAKQGYLADDMAPPSIPALDQASENYYETMMDRVVLSKEEDQMKTALIELLRKHNLCRYEYDDKIVMLSEKSNVKIKKAPKPVGDDPNEHAEE